MKKIFLFLFFVGVLFGESTLADFGKASLNLTKNIINQATNLVSDEPDWIRQYKKGEFKSSDNEYFYFIGISSSMFQTKQQEATNDARKNALEQISSYINVDVVSNTTKTNNISNQQYSSNTNKKLSLLSLAALDGIREDKIYIEHNGNDIVVYALYKISKLNLQNRIDKYQKETKEYNKLLSELYDTIKTNQVSKAKDILFALSQYKMAKYDYRLSELKKQLSSSYSVDVELNKTYFNAGDDLKISLRSTTNVYVYVLLEYNNGKKIKLLFPNRYKKDNFIKANKLYNLNKLRLKKQYITKQGYPNRIIVYASKTILPFKEYVTKKYTLLSKKDAPWRLALANRIYFKDEIEFEVSHHKAKRTRVCVSLDGNSKVAKHMFEIAKNSLRDQKFYVSYKCNKAKFKIILHFNQRLKYDGVLEQNIKKINYYFSVLDSDQEEYYSTDETKVQKLAKATAQEIIKEIRADFEENVLDIVEQIKEEE